jgi:class 3 adenylate cyclase/tetratricopeptide (TPR) repeat protein
MVDREERKFVTVLFADLVGFTSRAERMDPEDVRAMLTSYHERVRSELERRGGTVEKFIGDAVMAVFGAPQAREDDSERAVRAALAIRDWIRDEESDLQVRIGVNMGEVLVALGARPSEGEAMVAGDVVNSASRLQSAAPINGILVGESTYRATRAAIEYREAAPVTAKGKAQPILVWEAIAPRARVAVERLGGADLVGRNDELTLLQDALARVKGEREPQLVTLVGVPGIGKSRLVFELFKSIEAQPDLVYWRRGRSLPYGEGVAFWALAEMVKAQAGILEGDSAEGAEGKLRTAVYDLIEDEGDARRVHTQIRPLIGLAGEGELRGAGREEAFAAWRRFFEAMADRRPLVMVFEDLHWADDALLDFVDALVDWAGGVPLLVLVTARPELVSRRPGWGGGKTNAVTISLSPLSDEETARLVHSLLGRSVLPAETQAALLERAGGNPLYAEEFVSLFQERGLKAGEKPALPESVQGILSARLDSLSGDDKTLLQHAAVLGRVFWAGALAHIAKLARREVEERLHMLERREFVRRERRPSVAGETEYAFRHLLVRDVAYAQIPRRLRAERHRLAAEWIESLGRPEDHAEVLAHHYLAALEYARASGQNVDTLAGPARVALRRAGGRALSLNAFQSAARFCASALELTPPLDPDRPQLLLSLGEAQAELLTGGASDVLSEAATFLRDAGDPEGAARAELLLGNLAWRHGQRDTAYDHVQQAVGLLQDSSASPTKARVLSEVSRYHMLGGRVPEAVEIGLEALAMAEQLGLPDIQAHALNNVGSARGFAGDHEGLDDLRRSIEIAAFAPVEELRARNNLGSLLLGLGDFRGAAGVWRAGIELAEHFRGVQTAEWVRSERMFIAYGEGRWDDLDRFTSEFLAEMGPAHYQAGFMYELRGRVRLARGDIAGGLSDADLTLSLAREAKDPQRLWPALAYSAFALLHSGRADEASQRVDELMRLDIIKGVRPGLAVDPVLDLAWILTALGRGGQFLDAAAGVTNMTPWHRAAVAFARGEVEQASDICAEMGILPNEAYMRLRAAEKLLGDGRPDAAQAQVEKAIAFYDSVGATAYIHQAEQLRFRNRTPEAASQAE